MRKPTVVALFLLLLLAAPAAAADGPAADAPAPRWLRVDRREGESIALEIAARAFGPREGSGPVVTLVGVVHVGDASYYRALEQYLAGFDLVLYESVKPEGAVAPGGKTDEERARTTRAALGFLTSLAGAFQKAAGAPPDGIEALRAWVDGRDVRLADFLDLCLTDGWRGAVSYVVDPGDGTAPGGFRFVSLGADGEPGGEGAAADIVVGSGDGVPAFARPEGDGLQVQLAKLLRLSFQLDGIDYGSTKWRSSDMTIDQVRAAISRRGGDPDELTGTLTGSSLSASLAKVLIGILRFGDALTGGLVSDAMKILMIELLADEGLTEGEGGPFDTPTMRAIIEDRNEVVVLDLARILAAADPPRRIAVFYGAGHMRDFEKRLADRLGYVPLAEAPFWFPAFRVDLEHSKVTPAMVEQLRESVRRRLGK